LSDLKSSATNGQSDRKLYFHGRPHLPAGLFWLNRLNTIYRLRGRAKMKGRFHGVFSLILIFAAVIVALIYMLNLSGRLGLAYLAIILIANPIVLYSYCAKCLCREDACSHVFPGKLTRLLPGRQQKPYTFGDYFWTGISLVALLGFPQIWLWQSKSLFIAFWILLLGG
jgi:hypothetical protein